MIMLATASVLFGAALGVRYKVPVLMFVMTCIGLGIAIYALVFSSTFSNIVSTLTLVFTGIQLGYIAGAAAAYLNFVGVPRPLGARHRGWLSR